MQNIIEKRRCSWCGTDPLYVYYHDNIWGRPVKNSEELFAKLCLDGQQAGLSWITILKKEKNYFKAFDNFSPEKLIYYKESDIDRLMTNSGIVRNKLKIESIIKNAKGYMKIQESGKDFNRFVWQFVDGKPKINHWKAEKNIPNFTETSKSLSKSLKKYGFSFVGETICYAFMQAVGMVNDHVLTCPQHEECIQQSVGFSLD